jgi:hypothetical protein
MRNWYGLDETREPWCFLTLDGVGGREPEEQPREAPLTGWALGVGNPDRLLSTESQQRHSEREEADLVVSLGEELDARRYTETTLITPDDRTVVCLRRRLMACGALRTPTLRGFTHIALEDVLSQYFDVNSVTELGEHRGVQPPTAEASASTVGDDPPVAVEQLWRAWTAVYRLVPTTACLGDPL